MEAGEKLNKMRFTSDKKVIATGGEENPLKIFDLQTGKQTFIAKNVPHDFLELRVPVSINDIGFYSADEQQIVTVGKYGHVTIFGIFN